MHGLIIGKFYPPHLGHQHLIETALSQVDSLEIIVCHREEETIAGTQRKQWLEELYPEVLVHEMNVDGLDRTNPQEWATAFQSVYTQAPEIYFTSEAHQAESYAALLNCAPYIVDAERANVPIAATLIRQNPATYLHFLPNNVRAHYEQSL